ncbi:hypothetical protein [Ahniella affigens]|uniref:hypothetical protein n=1 Tax=Ahniella affigens TaxID=2021234 RepID=UPI0011B204C0|nr:hypothetical protein [Ahniella affigens]
MNFWSLCEGQLDPALGKRINVLVGKDEDFIVYLDDFFGIQWSSDRVHWPRPEVLNKVAQLEAESSFIGRPSTLRDIRTQIGEALVRVLSEPSKTAATAGADLATDILERAEAWIKLENRACSRRWLAVSASCFGGVCGLVLFLMAARGPSFAEWTPWWHILGASLAGGIGAWVSVLYSSQTMATVDARTGKWNHVFEAFARIMIGVIGALLMALLAKGNFVPAIEGNNLFLLLGFGLACGASERLAPALIASVERAATKEPPFSAAK